MERCTTCGYRRINWVFLIAAWCVASIAALVWLAYIDRITLGYKLTVTAVYVVGMWMLIWRSNWSLRIHKLHSPAGTPSQ